MAVGESPAKPCPSEERSMEEMPSKKQKLPSPVESAGPSTLQPFRVTPETAWEHFRKLGSPTRHVAPMVDQSELPFRMLCRKYGAEAAYTPMLHSRLFVDNAKYRKEHFTTCPEDRPLFVQFCANNPAVLCAAAKYVEPFADYIDLNLGCPQGIARKGNYGSFLMDNLPLVRELVSALSASSSVPVSCKIRVFPKLEDTLAYAKMLEEAGCALLAVHGRTREQKSGRIRADWNQIKAVKEALRIPVLANGNVRDNADVEACMAATGVEGVLAAEALLEYPALFAGPRVRPPQEPRSSHPACTSTVSSQPVEGLGGQQGSQSSGIQGGVIEGAEVVPWQGPDHISLVLEYLDLCEKYPVHSRMVRAHVHRLLGGWFRVHPDLREALNKEHRADFAWYKRMCQEMAARNAADPSLRPLPDPRRSQPLEDRSKPKQQQEKGKPSVEEVRDRLQRLAEERRLRESRASGLSGLGSLDEVQLAAAV